MKYGRDKRFKAIERMKERENLFHDFVEELQQHREKIRSEEVNSAEKVRTRLTVVVPYVQWNLSNNTH